MSSNLNILDPSAILSLLPSLLPSDSKKIVSPEDGIAALLHTAMSALAFRLVAVDDTAPGRSLTVLPQEWNKNGPGNYTFRYKHDQSSLEFVLKVSRLGGRTLINAIAVESHKAASLDISTKDFISPSFYPYDITSSDAQPLVHGFISSNRVADLLSQFKSQIIQKLIPGLRKEGYTEETTEVSTNTGASNPRNDPWPAPARPQPQAPPNVPDVHPYRIPPHNPLQIGRRDLDPFPQNPFSPPSLFPSGGDGMFVGPDHPIFGATRGRGNFGDEGPWGGDGFLPPMGAPPGARFDPVGPFPAFPGGPGGPRRGGPPRGGFGGPDNDEFMPPGGSNMFS